MNESATILSCKKLGRTFNTGPQAVEVLKEIDLQISAGDRIAIIGSSGSGKSTLLQCIGGLDQIDQGSLQIDGEDYFKLSAKKRAAVRNYKLGFVYQFHHLLAEFSAIENVAMPLFIRGEKAETALAQAQVMLEKVGLGHRLQHKPAELSGGERQRAAIARALVTSPLCLLADEPTGNLDSQTAEQIHQLMLELNQQTGCALVMVTHEQRLAEKMDRIYRLLDGALVTD